MDNYEFKPLTEKEASTIKRLHSTDNATATDVMHVGQKGYILTNQFKQQASDVRNLPLRDTDVFVSSFPRSGTTWSQELVWLIENNLDFDKAKSIPLTERYAFLELFMLLPPISMNPGNLENGLEKADPPKSFKTSELLASTPSPRFIKTHLPLSLLPKETIETAKVVYIARDPRDVAVSLYHFIKSYKGIGAQCGFKEFYYEEFSKDLPMYAPIFEHVKEAWGQRDHPNLLFLYYEELSQNLKSAAKRVCSFLDKQFTDEQLDQLCDHLTFNNFQKNKAIDIQDLLEDSQKNFVRKGKVGGWREYFDPEMEDHAAKWMEENLRGTGLCFQD